MLIGVHPVWLIDCCLSVTHPPPPWKLAKLLSPPPACLNLMQVLSLHIFIPARIESIALRFLPDLKCTLNDFQFIIAKNTNSSSSDSEFKDLPTRGRDRKWRRVMKSGPIFVAQPNACHHPQNVKIKWREEVPKILGPKSLKCWTTTPWGWLFVNLHLQWGNEKIMINLNFKREMRR